MTYNPEVTDAWVNVTKSLQVGKHRLLMDIADLLAIWDSTTPKTEELVSATYRLMSLAGGYVIGLGCSSVLSQDCGVIGDLYYLLTHFIEFVMQWDTSSLPELRSKYGVLTKDEILQIRVREEGHAES